MMTLTSLLQRRFGIVRTTRSGQIAVGTLVVMAFLLIVVSMTVNLGQMAQVRVETSNAADAAALAAASWMASGENEAAFIAGKMYDAIAMVQAIYLVPFCPGPAHRAYAAALWGSLYQSTFLFGIPVPGPIKYFQEVADAAMLSAENVGRRELFTAAVNNLMIRYDTAYGGSIGDGGIAIDPLGDLPQRIRQVQENQYNCRHCASTVLDWNNGLPVGHPQRLVHVAVIDGKGGVTADPPTLEMYPWAATFYQYNPPEDVMGPMTIFPCEFEGVGIRSTLANGPLVNLRHADLPDNPLAVDPATGRKGWDIPLAGSHGSPRQVIPSIWQLDWGVCTSHVCGISTWTTAAHPVVPLSIRGGNGTVTATVSHEVNTETSNSLGLWWQRRFRNVASRAVARYTKANVFLAPTPNAGAYLERTE